MSSLTDDYIKDRRVFYARNDHSVLPINHHAVNYYRLAFQVAIQLIIMAVELNAKDLPHICLRVMCNAADEIEGIGIGSKRGPGGCEGQGSKVWINFNMYESYMRRRFSQLEYWMKSLGFLDARANETTDVMIKNVSDSVYFHTFRRNS